MGIETDNFSAVVNPEQISPLVPDFPFGPYNQVRFMSDSVREQAKPANVCPHCGKVDDTLSSQYCPEGIMDLRGKYALRLRKPSPEATRQPITSHAA